MVIYMSLPPTEDPTIFPLGLIFNPLFFESENPLSQTVADNRYLNKIQPDTATALETFSAGINTTTLKADTIQTDDVKSNDGTKSLINFDGTDINITQNMNAFNIVGQSLKTNIIKGSDEITYISYDASNENTTISKVATTTLKANEIIRNDPTENVKIFNGSGFGVNLQTATSETFIANQLKIGQTGSSLLVKADSVDITGIANITTISNLPLLTSPVSYVIGGTDYTVLNKLGGTWDTGFVFNILYTAGTSQNVYAIADPFPVGLYLASVYLTIPPNTSFRLRCLSTELPQVDYSGLVGNSYDNAPLIRRYIGNATETETSMTGQLVISTAFQYISFFSQLTGTGTNGRTLRLILTRIG